MSEDCRPDQSLLGEVEELRRQLAEANETLDAIRSGAVDALVIKQGNANQIFTLEGAERPYRLFVEEMQQGAVTLSRTFTILYCNRHFSQMLQYDPGQLAGRSIEQLVAPGSRGAWQQLLRQAEQARAVGEVELLRQDGSLLPAFAAVHVLPSAQGGCLSVVVADLTEQRHYERLAVAERQLKEALAAAEQASRAKDHFLAMLGHELRNPLGPIRNSVALMGLAGPGDSIIKGAREVIDRQVTHLTRLIDDLLDISRITTGKITLREEEVDLAQVVAAAVADHRPLLEGNGLQLGFVPPPGPVPVLGDGARLAQIISNLLVNANKFTDRGGRVLVQLAPDGAGRAAITVSDTGIGLGPDALAHLFETFMQVDQAFDRSRGGLGLGLALVKGLVELHGGEVNAHSDGPGRGSTFTVVLPLLQGRPPAAAPAVPAAEAAIPRPLRILVIEDNVDAADTLRMLLELSGHTAAVAGDGPGGLALASAQPPEVVLCDIGLPGGMDGYAVAAAMRAAPDLAGAFLVAMTGFGQEEDRQHALQAGFDAQLTKPADPDALLDLLASTARSRTGCSGHPGHKGG